MEPQQKAKGLVRRNKPGSIEQAFAHESSWLYFQSMSAGHGTAIRKFRYLEKTYVSQLYDYPELALEIRRRVAEMLLDLTLVHGCKLPTCRATLKKLERLGWSEWDRKLHFQLLYARGTFARGHSGVAKKIAREAAAEIQARLDELEKRTNRRGRKYLTDLLDLMTQVLDAIQKAEDGLDVRIWDRGGRFVHSRSTVNLCK